MVVGEQWGAVGDSGIGKRTVATPKQVVIRPHTPWQCNSSPCSFVKWWRWVAVVREAVSLRGARCVLSVISIVLHAAQRAMAAAVLFSQFPRVLSQSGTLPHHRTLCSAVSCRHSRAA